MSSSSNQRTYLVTGATGDVGSKLVAQLLLDGVRPRVFVRNIEKARACFGDIVDIFAGDLRDQESLRFALQGVHSLFVVNSGPDIPERDEMMARLAKSAGVKHLVKLSSMDVQH